MIAVFFCRVLTGYINIWGNLKLNRKENIVSVDTHESMQQIRIAVAAHKSYRMPMDDMYLPVHVGKALHPEINLGKRFVADNSGENISFLNNYYSELTALYWIWKNDDTKYKGLVHYRRHFETANVAVRVTRHDRFEKIVNKKEVAELFSDTNIILPRRRNYVIETVRSHYAHTFPVEQLDETREIIASNTKEYIEAFDDVMSGTTAHMFNMMIMRKDKLDEYCGWLFPILFELQHRIDPSIYDSFNARYPGRISEMLLDVWLKTNEYSYRELPVISTEPVNWAKKGSAFLAAKFIGKKYESSF